MSDELTIYISAAPEMDAECELVGQLLAEVPRSRRWRIRRTPGVHEPGNPDLVALAESQFYLILLGGDVYAPIGLEASRALQADLPVFAHRCLGYPPAPATSHFAHNVGLRWQSYQTPAEFARAFERQLVTQLIAGTPGYGLLISDIEELMARQEAFEAQARDGEALPESEERRRGAGRGGIILEA